MKAMRAMREMRDMSRRSRSRNNGRSEEDRVKAVIEEVYTRTEE